MTSGISVAFVFVLCLSNPRAYRHQLAALEAEAELVASDELGQRILIGNSFRWHSLDLMLVKFKLLMVSHEELGVTLASGTVEYVELVASLGHVVD